MGKYDVKVRYFFEGTYTVRRKTAMKRKGMVAEDCGLVLGGNIHTTRDDDEVTDWKFGCHPDLQVLSVRERGGKSPMSVFGTGSKNCEMTSSKRYGSCSMTHCLNAIRFPEEDYDSGLGDMVWQERRPIRMQGDRTPGNGQQPDRPCRRERKR